MTEIRWWDEEVTVDHWRGSDLDGISLLKLVEKIDELRASVPEEVRASLRLSICYDENGDYVAHIAIDRDFTAEEQALRAAAKARYDAEKKAEDDAAARRECERLKAKFG